MQLIDNIGFGASVISGNIDTRKGHPASKIANYSGLFYDFL